MAEHVLVARQSASGPPLPPPSPEYLAQDVGPRLLTVAITLYIISTTVILLRFYVRIVMLKMFRPDDWMMLISGILSTALLVLWVKVVHTGLGKHAQAYPMQNFGLFFAIMYYYSVLIIASYTFIKFSIGIFLWRLADRTRWRPFLIGMLVFLLCFMLGSISAIIFQCNPIRGGWDVKLRPPTGKAKCFSPTVFKNIGVFNSSVNIATDLLFAIIPIPMVWRLHIDLRTRIGLVVILSLGFFASATAIYKVPMQYHFFEQLDWSGHGSWYYIWQLVEMHVGILAACLPTLKPLVTSIFGRIRTLTKGRTSTPGQAKSPSKLGDKRIQIVPKNISSDSSLNRDLYHEEVALRNFGYVANTPPERPRRHSQAGESDESIFREHWISDHAGDRRAARTPAAHAFA